MTAAIRALAVDGARLPLPRCAINSPRYRTSARSCLRTGKCRQSNSMNSSHDAYAVKCFIRLASYSALNSRKGTHSDMFKKTKGGSSFKSGKVSSGAAEKKEILEELGYAFDSVTKKSGWSWSMSAASSEHNQSTEGDAIADA